MQLTLSSGPGRTVDLSSYVDVQDGDGFDIANPQFTTKIWARSMLREGATEALEQNVEREILIPLKLGPTGAAGAPTTLTQTLQLVALINQLVRTPGATLRWQTDGASQPTYFDGISGQCDITYSYRHEQQMWTKANLRFFAQPFGRAGSPRPFAAASAVGPLLMITPYASSGQLAVTASTQGGAAGFGGQQQGASSGVFYPGTPSLAGDAAAQLQISYVGPLPSTGTTVLNTGTVPYVAVALLPDQNYRPLITSQELQSFGTASTLTQTGAVASQYISVPSGAGTVIQFLPVPKTAPAPGVLWAGPHRLLAIARASQTARTLTTQPNPLVGYPTVASVNAMDWGLYDLGTFTLRASEPGPGAYSQALNSGYLNVYTPPAAGTLDITAFVMLPDSRTWFVNPQAVTGGAWQTVAQSRSTTSALQMMPFSNTVLIDDIVRDQFLFNGTSVTSAPSPAAPGCIASATRITQYTRGLVPQPDPNNGPPIIAILGVGQTTGSPTPGFPVASWSSQQNMRTMAQITALERTRYVLP